MAFLLGNESCIDSLRCDLNDIQETIDDILGRLGGNVKYYSWKFPDKMASDVKIDELLEFYKYSANETHNQVTHYTLLELIIDRLILMINLSNTQIEKTLNLNDGNSKPPSAAGFHNNLSAGLAIKKYWSKFTHLCSTLRQLYGQNKALKQKEVSSVTSNGASEKNTKIIREDNKHTIADDLSNKHTQTIETAFVPCESCNKVQSNLKQNADTILNILHFQNIPSSIAKYRSSFSSPNQAIGWLNASDMSQWLNEQDKDLNKISKHIEFLLKNNEILKIKLSECEANILKLTESEKELKKQLKDEHDVRTTMMKQYEKKLVDQRTELNNLIANKENQVKNLTKTKESLDSQVSSLNVIKKENEKTISELNDTIRVLNQELEVKNDEKEKFVKLDQEKIVLSTELECKKNELNEKTKELNKERIKLENAIRHEQSLQSKQEMLISSLDQITSECEDLKNQLNTIESDKEYFESQHATLIADLQLKENKFKEYETEKNILNKNIDDLKSSLNILNSEVKKLKEKEMLLLQYPDLYGPIQIQKETDLLTDMEFQIQANKYRIDLLESQNQKLKISIQKLASANNVQQQQQPLKQNNEFIQTNLVNRPVPLFKLENEINEEKVLNETIKDNHVENSYWKNCIEPTVQSNQHRDVICHENIFIHTSDYVNQANYIQQQEYEKTFQNIEKRVNSVNHQIMSDTYVNGVLSVRRNSISSPNPYRSNSRQQNSARNNTPISPPVKDMEVVIGKGHHRPNSASRPPTSTTKRPSSAFSNKSSVSKKDPTEIKENKYYCERCYKNYSIKRDLDIHKMYCNK